MNAFTILESRYIRSQQTFPKKIFQYLGLHFCLKTKQISNFLQVQSAVNIYLFYILFILFYIDLSGYWQTHNLCVILLLFNKTEKSVFYIII